VALPHRREGEIDGLIWELDTETGNLMATSDVG
jgi:hypothetical protein